MRSDVITAARDQAERQAAARKLLRQAAGKLEVTIGGRLLVRDPELARQLAALKPEVRELLSGIRCVACGEPLGEQARLPSAVGFIHRHGCAGYARRPVSTQVRRD